MNIFTLIIGITLGFLIPIAFFSGWVLGIWSGKEAVIKMRKDFEAEKLSGKS